MDDPPPQSHREYQKHLNLNCQQTAAVLWLLFLTHGNGCFPRARLACNQGSPASYLSLLDHLQDHTSSTSGSQLAYHPLGHLSRGKRRYVCMKQAAAESKYCSTYLATYVLGWLTMALQGIEQRNIFCGTCYLTDLRCQKLSLQQSRCSFILECQIISHFHLSRGISSCIARCCPCLLPSQPYSLTCILALHLLRSCKSKSTLLDITRFPSELVWGKVYNPSINTSLTASCGCSFVLWFVPLPRCMRREMQQTCIF